MRIEHVAIWTRDLERLKSFYETYFEVTLSADGHTVVDGPRATGDGYYESVALDPDGNRIELTV
jgi:predicted enzyme related to lactoylglutathione lyase